MTEQEDKQERVELAQVNAELKSSLKRCRALLTDCREKLAANSNEDVEEDSAPDDRAQRSRPGE